MKRVVIVGGGFAGTYLAKKLERSFKVTLIDSKDYFEFTPGILRTLMNPRHAPKIHVCHRTYLRKSRVIVGCVSNIREQEAVVNRKRVPFDYLVICSGSSYRAPIKEYNLVLPTRAKHLQEAHAKLPSARDILIIGGGLVGVELAAEIVTHYPDKQVCLVHAHDRLMERNHERAIRSAERFLLKRGVRIIYNERVVKAGSSQYLTDTGTHLHADLAFLCTGITPHSSFLRQSFKHLLNKEQFVRVNSHLQLEGYPYIFAAGDITDCIEEKTAQNAQRQAKIVVANIQRLARGKLLKKYCPRTTPLVVSLGAWNGIFEYHTLVISGLIPAFLKAAIEVREMWRRKYLPC